MSGTVLGTFGMSGTEVNGTDVKGAKRVKGGDRG